ncbi:hypothetical protein LguiB_020691 [Lonicera macranthoides]
MYESKFLDRIVQEIWSKLPPEINVENKGLVGMKSRIKKVTSLLGEKPNVVCTVGIWGLSGIGKSTLAWAVYRQIQDRFEVAYFLDDIASKKGGLRSLQQLILSKILRVKDLQIANDMDGIALMKTRLRSRRVLLVLDDVDSSKQLEALAGSHEWFGPGSRIIITTRDRKLLPVHDGVQIHEVSVLNHIEATQLFYWNAFNDMCPAEDFMELSIQGTENIEGIMLHPHEQEYTIEMGTEAFRKMTKLRLLEIHNACIPKGPDYLPDELRWIDWDKYPSNSLPAMFEANVLVGLRLRCSRLKQLWDGRTKIEVKRCSSPPPPPLSSCLSPSNVSVTPPMVVCVHKGEPTLGILPSNWTMCPWLDEFSQQAEQVLCATTYPFGEFPKNSWATNGHYPIRVSPGVVLSRVSMWFV